MAEQWNGITVRNTSGETGDVPRSASSQSPDIIISGQQPMADPWELEREENYGNSYSNNLYIGLPNYLYVRGKNFTDTKYDGQWTLYYSESNVLLYPYLWEPNQLKTSAGNMRPPFSIEPGKIGASTDSYVWVPPEPTNGHYCMIAVAETPEHGNPLAGVSNVTSLAETLSNNANIAQRNTNMIRSPGLPQVVSTTSYNQGADAHTMDLTFVYTNMPYHTKYTISSGTPLDGKIIDYSGDDTDRINFKEGLVGVEIPANWSTLFTYTLDFTNADWTDIPEGAIPTVEVRGELVMDETHALYALGEECLFHPVNGEKRLSVSGGPVRILIAGSVTSYNDVRPA